MIKKGEWLTCGCDCNLGPVEKRIVELMRLHTPPYEMLRVLAAAIDNANMENERLERLILTVKEDGVEAVIPTKISDLVDDRGLVTAEKLDMMVSERGFAKADAVTDVRTSLEEEIEKKVSAEALDDMVAGHGFAKMDDVNTRLEDKLDKAGLDAAVSALGYTKQEYVDNNFIKEIKKEDIVNALGYTPSASPNPMT